MGVTQQRLRRKPEHGGNAERQQRRDKQPGKHVRRSHAPQAVWTDHFLAFLTVWRELPPPLISKSERLQTLVTGVPGTSRLLGQ